VNAPPTHRLPAHEHDRGLDVQGSATQRAFIAGPEIVSKQTSPALHVVPPQGTGGGEAQTAPATNHVPVSVQVAEDEPPPGQVYPQGLSCAQNEHGEPFFGAVAGHMACVGQPLPSWFQVPSPHVKISGQHVLP
jgi:hypothetical protein